MSTTSDALPDRLLPRTRLSRQTWASTFAPALLLAPAVLLLLTFFVLPLLYMARYSVARYDPFELVVRVFTLENYAKFVTDEYSRSILFRTLRISVLSTLFSLVMGYPLAYYMMRVRGLEKTLLVMFVLWPLMISPVILAYGWLVLIAANSGLLSTTLQSLGILSQPLRLMNTEWAIVLGLTHQGLAYMVLNLHSALEAIDASQLRAAAILGARPFQAFRKVTLPLSLPGIVSGCVLVFAISSSAFMTPFMLTGRKFPVLAVYAYDLNVTSLNWPLGAATGLVLLIIALISLLLFGNYVSRLRAKLGME